MNKWINVKRMIKTNLTRVDLHDSGPSFFVGMGELDLAIETTGSKKRWIQDVDSIRGRDHFDLAA